MMPLPTADTSHQIAGFRHGRPFGVATVGWLCSLAIAFFCLILTGCKTTSSSGSKVTTTVIVEGNTPARVLYVTREVFLEHGYQDIPAVGMSLTFEKKGNTMDGLLYGNWTEGVWLRARVTVVELSAGRCAIDCNASYVRDKDAGFMEDEQTRPGSGPYRKILEEVKKRLAFPDPAYSGSR
jgi:hypothetical protein